MWKLQNEKNLNTAQNHGNGSDLTVSEESADPSAPWIRSGPTGVEVVLTHAVSRMMLAGHIDNIQVWMREARRLCYSRVHCSTVDCITLECITVECSTVDSAALHITVKSAQLSDNSLGSHYI